MRDKINDVERYAVKAKGRNELLNYFRGKPLTYKQAILGHCYSCMNFYSDGKVDCKIPSCCLYPFMPYRDTL